MQEHFTIFSGTASRALAARVAHVLEQPLGACTVARFADGEVSVRLEEPVRGRDVFLIQSTCPPVDEHLIELLTMADACRRSSAARVTAIVPYFGYSRADKRSDCRTGIGASMVAEFLQSAGVDHVITVDLHASQIEGFFRIPVDCLTAVPAIANSMEKTEILQGTAVVSPDEGRLKMAVEYGRRLHAPVAVLHKERNSDQCDITHVIGDVRGRPCLIIDDMITTGTTISEAVSALLKAGARPHITVAATHGVFAPGAFDKLTHTAIQSVIVTDSISPGRATVPHLHVISLAPLLAAAIRRIRAGESLGDLFTHVIHGGLVDEAEQLSA